MNFIGEVCPICEKGKVREYTDYCKCTNQNCKLIFDKPIPREPLVNSLYPTNQRKGWRSWEIHPRTLMVTLVVLSWLILLLIIGLLMDSTIWGI